MLKVVTSAAFFALFTCTAWAQGNASTTSAQNENSGPKSEELNKAAQTVQDLTSSNQIPQQLLSQAKCIAATPSTTRGGFIAGGKPGSGAVTCRTANAWSAPAFFSIS